MWKKQCEDTYKNAYISLCLPKLFTLFARIELIAWNPLSVSSSLKRAWQNSVLLCTYIVFWDPNCSCKWYAMASKRRKSLSSPNCFSFFFFCYKPQHYVWINISNMAYSSTHEKGLWYLLQKISVQKKLTNLKIEWNLVIKKHTKQLYGTTLIFNLNCMEPP